MSKGSCFNDLYTFGNRNAGGAMMSAKNLLLKIKLSPTNNVQKI